MGRRTRHAGSLEPPAHEVGWLFIPQDAELRELSHSVASAVPVFVFIGFARERLENRISYIHPVSDLWRLRASQYVAKCSTQCRKTRRRHTWESSPWHAS